MILTHKNALTFPYPFHPCRIQPVGKMKMPTHNKLTTIFQPLSHGYPKSCN